MHHSRLPAAGGLIVRWTQPVGGAKCRKTPVMGRSIDAHFARMSNVFYRLSLK